MGNTAAMTRRARSLSAGAFAAAPAWFVRCFTDDPAVTATGAQLMVIAALFQLFDGVQAVATGALRGAGDVRFPFAVTLVR